MTEGSTKYLGEVHPTPLMRIYRATNGFIVTIYSGPGLQPEEFVAITGEELGLLVRSLVEPEKQ